MNLRSLLAHLDEPQEDRLSEDQRNWLLEAAASRVSNHDKQTFLEQRIAYIDSSAQLEDVEERRRQQFWEVNSPAAQTPRVREIRRSA